MVQLGVLQQCPDTTQSRYILLYCVCCSRQGSLFQCHFLCRRQWQRQFPFTPLCPHRTYTSSRSIFGGKSKGLASGSSSLHAHHFLPLAEIEFLAHPLHFFEHQGHLCFQTGHPAAAAAASLKDGSCVIALGSNNGNCAL